MPYGSQIVQETLIRLKSEPCTDCARSYPPYVMDFDHVRGKKEDSISKLVRRGCSVELLLVEIAKCDLVCANCHRERTQARWGYR